MILHAIQFIALFLLTLVTGVFWGPWLALHRSIDIFTAGEFILIVQTMAKNLAGPMQVLMPGCILFLGLSAWFYPSINTAGFYLSIAAVALSVIALLVTLLIEVPIVAAIQQWTTVTIPANWKAMRNRWRFFHVVRIIASLGSFACFLLSLMFLMR